MGLDTGVLRQQRDPHTTYRLACGAGNIVHAGVCIEPSMFADSRELLTGLVPSQHGVHSFLSGGNLQTGPNARCTLDD